MLLCNPFYGYYNRTYSIMIHDFQQCWLLELADIMLPYTQMDSGVWDIVHSEYWSFRLINTAMQNYLAILRIDEHR